MGFARGAATPTLKGKAVRLLAQREHSRAELQSKLLRHAQQLEKRAAQASNKKGAEGSSEGDAVFDSGLDSDNHTASRAQLQADINRAVDELAASGLQSDERTAQALLQAQSRRLGAYRLKQKMQDKGLAPELVAQALSETHGTEFQRALDLWSRRFGSPALERSERARQARFLISRGFASDIVQKVLRTQPVLPDEDLLRANGFGDE